MEVRITKYNPQFRDERGAYSLNDWTSVSDIGRVNGLTCSDYMQVENDYWTTLRSIFDNLGISSLVISDLEMGSKSELAKDLSIGNELEKEAIRYCLESNLKLGQTVSIDEFQPIFQAAMRDVIWLKAHAEGGAFVHFGYDFYLYAGSTQEFSWESVDGIFVESFKSPYRNVLA